MPTRDGRRDGRWFVQVARVADTEASEAFDTAFWEAATPAERVVAAMQMASDYLALTGSSNADQRALRGTNLRIFRR